MTREGAEVLSGEIKSVREGLSLTTAAMAALLSVSEGTVKSWERGRYRVPDGVAVEVERLEAYTRRAVNAVAEAADRAPVRAVIVYRHVDDMPAGPARTLGPAWWRSVAWRARERVDGLAIGYLDEVDRVSGSRDATLRDAVGADTAPPIG